MSPAERQTKRLESVISLAILVGIILIAISIFIRPTSAEILNPIPTMGVPKNSATIAPIIAKVELIFNALRIKGIAFGSRKLKSSRQ